MFGSDPLRPTAAQALADLIVEQADLHPPVDVEALVRELAEVREVSFSSDVGLDAVLTGISGRNLAGDPMDRPVLLLNNNTPTTRRRFTLAHEHGHLNMAWHVGTITCDIDAPLVEGEDSAAWVAGSDSFQLERDADEFASRLLIPARFIAALDQDDPGSMLGALAATETSPEASIYGLASLLPPGFVFVQLDPFNHHVYRYAYSYGSFNVGLRQGGRFDEAATKRFLSSSGSVELRGARIFWGRVEAAMEVTTSSDEWQEILEGILTRDNPASVRGSKVWSSAQAVASAAHSEFGHDDVNVLARRIKQRFLKREEYAHLTEDPAFDDFASARANAFALGKRRT